MLSDAFPLAKEDLTGGGGGPRSTCSDLPKPPAKALPVTCDCCRRREDASVAV